MSNLLVPSTIRLFDSATLNLLGEIDNCQSIWFERSFWEAGSFEIIINQNTANALLFAKGQIIQFAQDYNCIGFVTEIDESFDKSGKGSEILTITGCELKGISNFRYVIPGAGNSRYTVTGPGETCIKTVFGAQGGPSTVDTNRIFPNLIIATDQGRGATYTLSARYSNLYDELYNCGLGTLIGWYIYFNPMTKKLILECSQGTSRIAGSSVPAIFTQRNGQLSAGNHQSSWKSYRNFGYVGGSGTGASRNIVTLPAAGIPSGFGRFEDWIPVPQYTTTPDITYAGNLALQKEAFTEFFDATALNSSQLQYRRDYNLGDLVTIQYFTNSYNARISKIKETWEELLYIIDLTFDKPLPELTQVQIDQNMETDNSINTNN